MPEITICLRCYGSGRVKMGAQSYWEVCGPCGGTGKPPAPPVLRMTDADRDAAQRHIAEGDYGLTEFGRLEQDPAHQRFLREMYSEEWEGDREAA